MHPLKKSQRWLVKRGFQEFRPSAELMEELAGRPVEARRGIYVHAMKEGTEFYAGLSIDVVERYKQHLQTYGVIEHSAFLHVPDAPLEPIESDVIDDLRRIKVTLLNVLVPSQLERSEDDDGDSDDDTDGTWTPDDFDHKEWMSCHACVDDTPPKPYDPQELPKFAKRYADLQASPGYTPEVLQFVRYFVRAVLPSPVESQRKYWAINCLTEAYRKESQITLFRISIYRPELLAIHLNKDKSSRSPYHFVFTLGVLGGCAMEDLLEVQQLPGHGFYQNPFKTARFNHAQLTLESLEDAWAFVRNPAGLKMLKQAAWSLMDSGKLNPRFAQAHCLPLAAEIFSGEVTLPPRYASATIDDILARPELDSVWLGDYEYQTLIAKFLERAAAGDVKAAEGLVRHASRSHYRSEPTLRLGAQEFAHRALELAKKHPEIWKVLAMVAQSKGGQYAAAAAYAACAVRPAPPSRPLLMAEEFIAGLKGASAAKKVKEDDLLAATRHIHEGAILAGIVHTGDRRILAMAESAWPLLDGEAQAMFFRLFPETASYVYVEFALNRLCECEGATPLARQITDNLRKLPIILDELLLGELEFGFGSADPDKCPSKGVSGETFASYVGHSGDEIRTISDDSELSQLIENLLHDWSLWDSED